MWTILLVPHSLLLCLYQFIVNSLAAGKFEWHFRFLIFQIVSVIDGQGISCETALRWMSLDLIDDKSSLVQVMAWCRQATSHYLSQCWLRSISPNGVTRPQWVKVERNILYYISLTLTLVWSIMKLLNIVLHMSQWDTKKIQCAGQTSSSQKTHHIFLR